MIIEPVPLGPPSAPRRRLRALALVVPLVLLGGVVAAGTFGPQASPSPSLAAVAVESPATTPSVSPREVAEAPATGPAGLPPGMPPRIAGLDVLTVAEALERRRDGLLGGVTAVGGYFGVREATSCGGTFCARTGIIAATPFTAATGFADIGVHLHPQLPVGVVLPRAANLAQASPAPDGPEAPPAVLIVRFDDPRARACLPAGRHCGEELVVERVVWVDDDSYPAIRAVEPGMPVTPRAIRIRTAGRAAERALGAGATPMLSVLVRPGTIAYIDPGMAPVLADLWPDPVWYVRGLRLGPGEPAIEWVIARADGSLILNGEQRILSTATASPR